ncbi:D-alanyl-D-alanine carboxypeptidase [Siccirubricoccus sp. KC 17139]|uniref:serine-type D-Ala-D-Ala carboxypeptidase n=1 Tax=Siccirubricoccus soli TaxID=2899147 RepID=A0ABT1D3Q7_9PROT|nr:D-alanyl-D-alanine carboxypeptidase family protein [Siccirubricoccus soli]MCO6416252.1 D-alanyl-D-alanine carboxypeptidase [Siccirubricoccus soli]MCP2682386.1 D-alanyl-D-alanine carboxypeptidase [Siccirubricoccus soli]
MSRPTRSAESSPGRRAVVLSAAAASLPLPALAQSRGSRAAPAARPAPPPTSPANTPLGPLDTQAKQALVIDYDTDAVLLEKNADERMPPSSMSKLMTMYLVFERLKQGRLTMSQELPVSERAWRMGGSKMFVQIGTTVPVEALIRGVIVQSGNDACVVLAEAISGSEQQFAEELNAKAREIGLTDSNFRNATGWPDPEHRMTCRDLARLAKRLIADFPDYYRVYNERSFRWNDITQENRNPTLARVPGADGLKTGHTEEAGYGLTASAKRGERRLILVFNGLTSMRARAEESERLLEWGFREFENVVLFRAQDVIEEVPVHLGERSTVPLVGGRDVVVTLPRQWRRNLQARLRYDAPVAAPVLKGTELGRLEVSGQGVPPMSLPLMAGADVDKLGLVARIPAVIGRWVGGG